MDSDEEGYEEDFEGTGEVDFLSGRPPLPRNRRRRRSWDTMKVKASKRNKVVNINTTAQLQVVLVKPEKFEDASAVADHLNAKRTVVLNLEGTNKDISLPAGGLSQRGGLRQQRPDPAGRQQHLHHHPLQRGPGGRFDGRAGKQRHPRRGARCSPRRGCSLFLRGVEEMMESCYSRSARAPGRAPTFSTSGNSGCSWPPYARRPHRGGAPLFWRPPGMPPGGAGNQRRPVHRGGGLSHPPLRPLYRKTGCTHPPGRFRVPFSRWRFERRLVGDSFVGEGGKRWPFCTETPPPWHWKSKRWGVSGCAWKRGAWIGGRPPAL